MQYKTLTLYKTVKGEFNNPDVKTIAKRFKGIIWQKSVVSFLDGKQQSNLVPTLMYDLGDISLDINNLNTVADTDGTEYIITEPYQPNGISGIIPQSFKTKVEIILEKVNE